MSALFRSFLPLENPIGFGFQDFVELLFALLILIFSLSSSRILQSRRLLAEFGALILAACATHALVVVGIGVLLPTRNRPAVERRIPDRTRPAIPDSAKSTRKTEPPRPKKQVSPFEEVK